MKRIILFTIMFVATFAINLQLSAQISPTMVKKTVASEDQKEDKIKNDTTQKVTKGEKVEITVPAGREHSLIKGEFHGVLIQDSSLAPQTESKTNKKNSNFDKEETASDKDIAESPVSKIWNSFKAWVSRHIDIDHIELWKVGYLFLGILITLIIGRILRWVIENHFAKLTSKTNTEIDDRICKAVGKPSALFVLAIGVYLSSCPIITHFSPLLKNLFGRLCLAIGAGAIAWTLYRLISVIDYILTKLAERTDNNLDDLIVAIIRKSLKVTLVLLSFLFIGQNILEMNITALLAGAGVMGLAIAFAAQDTIANFFGSIMIILDQPFKVGDCIQISGVKGSVENVGFRSTRIRTFDGHLVSLPNKGVANESIENIAKRPFIKQTINLGLTYDTGYEKMEKAMKMLHKLLDDQKCMDPERLPRIVFDKFNDFSLNISVTVWWHLRDENGNITTPDYGEFMKWLHATDMEILKQFDAEGLEFAFPTNTTYLAYDEKRKVAIDVNSK